MRQQNLVTSVGTATRLLFHRGAAFETIRHKQGLIPPHQVICVRLVDVGSLLIFLLQANKHHLVNTKEQWP
jgi:hypothetical protein